MALTLEHIFSQLSNLVVYLLELLKKYHKNRKSKLHVISGVTLELQTKHF